MYRGAKKRREVAGHDPGRLDYPALAALDGTLVVFMGLSGLAEVTCRLIAAGKDPSTPAAAISSGTTAEQETATCELREIATLATELRPPTLVVIGEVVRLGERLSRPRDERPAGEEALHAAHSPVGAAIASQD